MSLKYISIFSGIEAATVAWESLGWKPIAFSEIDKFPSQVLQERFPDVPNLGDITQIDWSDYAGTVDIVVGGSPCQSFSIAGKREGLKGESGLMFEYIRCVREVMPRYFIWENVPGALSSEKGEAFRQLLREMDELGYGLAWRILDSQFFGVPQRRRRLFLVGSLGNKRSSEILFEPESVCWDYKSSRKKREELASNAKRSVGISSGECLAFAQNTIDVNAAAYTLKLRHTGSPNKGGGEGPLVQEDISATLSTQQDQTLFQQVVCMADDNANAAIGNDMCGSLKVGGSSPIVAELYENHPNDSRVTGPHETCPTVSARYGTGGGNTPIVRNENKNRVIVRKLTPKECERLQGFPDDWTLIPYKGKPIDKCPDSPRYKALGNSMAVPVMRWIGQRLQQVDRS